MFEVVLSNRFRKDLKLAAKRGLRLDELNAIVEQLAAGQTLPVRIPICLISRFKAAPPRGCFLFCPATTGSGDRSASWANMVRKKRPCPDGQRRLRDLAVAVLSLRRQDT